MNQEQIAIREVRLITKMMNESIAKRHYLNAAEHASTLVGIILSALSYALKNKRETDNFEDIYNETIE
jgi:hypothetical protein